MSASTRQADQTGDGGADQPNAVSIGLLSAATPETQRTLGVAFTSWNAVVGSAKIMRVMVGLSEAGWADAMSRVGPPAAAAILATVMEKVYRKDSDISSPGGYFRAMIDRKCAGELHLDRTLFGLANSSLKSPVTVVTPLTH